MSKTLKFKITDIDWDTDGEEVDLPTEVVADIDVEIEDDPDDNAEIVGETIGDWLSDTYGFCHNGFEWDIA